jgi:hypothetical protein
MVRQDISELALLQEKAAQREVTDGKTSLEKLLVYITLKNNKIHIT